jgi:cell division protein ZapD
MVSIPTADLFTEAAASSATGLYEQPLSERMRTFLRLEFLYQQFCFNLEQTSEWGSRAAVTNMLDIVTILGRGDVRGDVLKELERQIGVYDGYQNIAGIDEARLKRVLRNLKDLRQRLFAVGPQFMQPIRESEFLAAIKHRSAIPGGTCEFDLPEYSHWLRQPFARRAQDFEIWLGAIRPVCDAVVELLWLIRECAQPVEKVAAKGMYQHRLQKEANCRLVRVALPNDSELYPEISGNQHHFTVRFLEWSTIGSRAVQTANDVRFRISIC